MGAYGFGEKEWRVGGQGNRKMQERSEKGTERELRKFQKKFISIIPSKNCPEAGRKMEQDTDLSGSGCRSFDLPSLVWVTYNIKGKKDL